jgi:hypothetical protein
MGCLETGYREDDSTWKGDETSWTDGRLIGSVWMPIEDTPCTGRGQVACGTVCIIPVSPLSKQQNPMIDLRVSIVYCFNVIQ